LVIAALALLSSAQMYGQAVSGSLLGTVIDSTGAVVPAAKVTITETKTGSSRTMETNASGNFAFPTLEPGTYQVAVEREGFRKAVTEGVELLVNTSVRADLVLQPGSVNESVT